MLKGEIRRWSLSKLGAWISCEIMFQFQTDCLYGYLFYFIILHYILFLFLFCQVWFKNKRAKYRQQRKQQHQTQNKPDLEKGKSSPPTPPPDQARVTEKTANSFKFKGAALPQADVAELLKQNCQTLANNQRQRSYQPSRSVNNNFESLLAELTSAAMQPAQLHSSKVQGFPNGANLAAPISSTMAINPGIPANYFTSVTMQHWFDWVNTILRSIIDRIHTDGNWR